MRVLTVALTTAARPALLDRTLRRMARVHTPPGGWRLLVCDNAGDDATASVLAGHGAALPLSVLRVERPGMTAALNAAIPHLAGDLMVKADDDILPDPGWLCAFRAAADAAPDVTLFGGRVTAEWPGPLPPWLWRDPRAGGILFATVDLPAGPCAPRAVYGPHWAIRTAAFARGATFDERIGPDRSRGGYPMGGETEFFVRLARTGARAAFVPEASVAHIIRPEQLTEAWVLERAYRCGLGAARIAWPGFRMPGRVRRAAWAAAAFALRGLPPSRPRTRALFTDALHRGMADAARPWHDPGPAPVRAPG